MATLFLLAGALLLAEAAITVVWQEPLSAVSARQSQKELEVELRTLEQRPLRVGDLRRLRREAERARLHNRRERKELEGERMRALATMLARDTRRGDALGRLAIPKLGLRLVVVKGTDEASLARGPGHYPGTALPGGRGTVAVAGHRTTYLAPFRNVHRLRPGDRIVLTMPYGRFEYRVARTAIVAPDDARVLRRAPHDRLVLTSCHPLYSQAQRIVVFAPLVRATPRGHARLPRRTVTVDRFDSRRAFSFVKWQVRLGPRPAGSPASRALGERLRRLLPAGRFEAVPGGLRNVIGTVPGRDPRRVVVLGAHYDTKDLPGFVGANDGASGTAVLAELARTLRPRQVAPTVVFAFFDGEESPAGTPGHLFESTGLRGSRVAAPLFAHAEAMVLVDMVGDRELRMPRERLSDPVLWERLRVAANRVGAGSVFPRRTRAAVLDDHVPFLDEGVPAINLIDFDFACWHRPCDDLGAVSERSLDAVGETLIALLRDL